MNCVDKLLGSATSDEKQSLLELRRNKLHMFLLKENVLYQVSTLIMENKLVLPYLLGFPYYYLFIRVFPKNDFPK